MAQILAGVAFLAWAALVTAVACSSGDDSELRNAPINAAEIVSLETMPPGYEVHVVAVIPGSSCHRPQEPSVERSGRTFRVSVQNLFTGADVCTADLGFRELAISLPGEFESGREYRVLVNDEAALTFVAE